MKHLIFIILVLAMLTGNVASKAFAGENNEVAAGVGATAASGLLAAPAGLNAALGSMAITGGLSLLTAGITNSDQKMYVKYIKRANKLIKKKKGAIPFADLKVGNYKYLYGTCTDSPKSMTLIKATDLYDQFQSKTTPDVVESWKKIHSGDTAFFIMDNKNTVPTLVFSDRTVMVYDQAGKNITCAGQVKQASYNKDIVEYCRTAKGFCNRVYEFTEKD